MGRAAIITVSSRAFTVACRLPLRGPLRIGPLQQVFRAGTAQMRSAILHHHLAVDVRGLIGNQEACESGEFAVVADAPERMSLRASAAAFGPKLLRCARRRKRSRRD